MKTALVFFFVFFFFVFFVFKVLAASAGDVVINEVVYNPSQSDAEWFELYNKTTVPVTLNGWSIADNFSFDLLPSITIPAFSFWVVAASLDVLTSYPNLVGKISYITDGKIGNKLANENDRLILKDENNVPVDQVSWGSDTTAFSPAVKTVIVGHSIERSPFGLDTDTAADFIDQSQPSPGNGFVPPTPTPIPSPTVTPSIPTVAPTSTPTLTPSPTATPSPTTIAKQISFTVPSEITIGQSFDISVSLSYFKANTLYYIKALIGKGLLSLTDGKTLGADGATWLAWNGSWNKMPKVTTDSSGSGAIVIKVKTDDDISAGDYQLVIRVKEADGSESVDSSDQTIKVSESTPSIVPTPSPTSMTASPSASKQTEKVRGTIKTMKQLDNGTKVETEGLVSAPFGVLGSDYFYIDDGDSGIMVKSKNKVDLKLGQRVKVASTIEESYGERYIKTDFVTIINNSLNPPVPQSVKLDKIDESLEGKLIVVSGRIFETSGKTFWISDGFGDIKIYIKDLTGIKIARKKAGDYVRIIGILSQWGLDDDEKPNYRLLPRFQSDVLISSAPIGGVGQVLGIATLPKTGVGLLELPRVIWQEIVVYRIRKMI